jgi:glycosyltransferase involved in cell wall biosynthesis
MKIALIVGRFDPDAGGLEQWVVRFARHLLDAGHEVHIVTFAAAETGLDVHLHLLPPAQGMMARARRIAERVATIGADITHDSGASWSGDVYQPQTGSPLLALDREIASFPAHRRLRAALSPRTRWRRFQMAKLEAIQARRARHIVAVSHRIRSQLAATHAIPAERITVIPNGVDTVKFSPARLAPMRAEMRARLGIGDAVLFVAGAHNMRLKGIDTALAALAALHRDGADIRLAVAGGAADAFWTTRAAALGIADRVHFLGQIAEMDALFAAADVCLHPTRWDACSLVTIEAMAAGLPVITTAMNGAAELIDPHRTGLVLPDPEDAHALAQTMRTLLDPALRARIGAAAHAAAQHYDVTDNCRAVEAVLIKTAACR